MPITTTTVDLGEGRSLTVTCGDEHLVIDLYDLTSETPTHTRTTTWTEVRESILGAFEATPRYETVAWLADHPGFAARMEYLDGSTDQWRPASEAIRGIDPGWPVEVREVQR